jgi:hypothetical protein
VKNKKFLENGWSRTKNGNLMKIINDVNYTIIKVRDRRFDCYSYSVYSNNGKMTDIPTLDGAKDEVHFFAYGRYLEDDSSSSKSFINDPMFFELCKSGYRTLSKKYHPDKGGDVSKMQELNNIWEKIKSDLSHP